MIILTLLFTTALDKRRSVELSYQNVYIINVFLTFFYRFSVGLSAYSVALLSIHRYRSTVSPSHVRVSSHISWRAAVAIFRRLWIVATLFALPSTLLMIIDLMCETLKYIPYFKYLYLFDVLKFCVLPPCVVAFS
jgi:phage shock protein PspC (stress-responsive transcriptional regulator)